MGTWATGIFDDDLAVDVQHEFDYLTLSGTKIPEAVNRVLRTFGESVADEDERIVVYSALSSLLLDCSIRTDPVFDETLALIESGTGMDRWEEAGPDAASERRSVLSHLATSIRRAQALGARFPKPPRCPKIVVGNILQLPLIEGGFAYAHYVFDDPQKGMLIAVLSEVYPEPVDPKILGIREYLFPPVFCGLRYAVREGVWQIVGWASTEHFVFPRFKSGIPDKNRVVHNWFIYDGKETVLVEDDVPADLDSLEELSTYPPKMITDRISDTIRKRGDNG